MKIVADKIRRTLETVTAAILSTTDTRNRLMMFNEMLSHRSADHRRCICCIVYVEMCQRDVPRRDRISAGDKGL